MQGWRGAQVAYLRDVDHVRHQRKALELQLRYVRLQQHIHLKKRNQPAVTTGGNFPCGLTTNIIPHSMKNVAVENGAVPRLRLRQLFLAGAAHLRARFLDALLHWNGHALQQLRQLQLLLLRRLEQNKQRCEHAVKSFFHPNVAEFRLHDKEFVGVGVGVGGSRSWREARFLWGKLHQPTTCGTRSF